MRSRVGDEADAAFVTNHRSSRIFVINFSRQAVRAWLQPAAVICALTLALVAFPSSELQGLVQLERLAPKIERAHGLSPEARQTIGDLIRGQAALSGLTQAQQQRRKVAIARVNAAIKTGRSALRSPSHNVGSASVH